jgi:hypothetical protein
MLLHFIAFDFQWEFYEILFMETVPDKCIQIDKAHTIISDAAAKRVLCTRIYLQTAGDCFDAFYIISYTNTSHFSIVTYI